MRFPTRYRLSLALLAVSQSACLYDNHSDWWVGDVATGWHACRGVVGDRAVLDLKRFRSVIVVPFAWGGYQLFVLTAPSDLTAGNSFSVPSSAAEAILCDLRHGARGEPITNLVGEVRVLRERRGSLLVQLDLKQQDQGYWSISGKHWFRRKPDPNEIDLSPNPSLQRTLPGRSPGQRR